MAFLWRFIKRHRRKIIFSSAFVAVGYASYNYALAKLRQWEEVEEAKYFMMLRKQQHYSVSQQTCDSIIISMLPKIVHSVDVALPFRDLIAALKKPDISPSDKLSLWSEIRTVAFARCVSLVRSLVVVIIVVRLQLNIVAGHIFQYGESQALVRDSYLRSRCIESALDDLCQLTHSVAAQHLQGLAAPLTRPMDRDALAELFTRLSKDSFPLSRCLIPGESVELDSGLGSDESCNGDFARSVAYRFMYKFDCSSGKAPADLFLRRKMLAHRNSQQHGHTSSVHQTGVSPTAEEDHSDGLTSQNHAQCEAYNDLTPAHPTRTSLRDQHASASDDEDEGFGGGFGRAIGGTAAQSNEHVEYNASTNRVRFAHDVVFDGSQENSDSYLATASRMSCALLSRLTTSPAAGYIEGAAHHIGAWWSGAAAAALPASSSSASRVSQRIEADPVDVLLAETREILDSQDARAVVDDMTALGLSIVTDLCLQHAGAPLIKLLPVMCDLPSRAVPPDGVVDDAGLVQALLSRPSMERLCAAAYESYASGPDPPAETPLSGLNGIVRMALSQRQ